MKKKKEEEVNMVTFGILIKALGVKEVFAVQEENPNFLFLFFSFLCDFSLFFYHHSFSFFPSFFSQFFCQII